MENGNTMSANIETSNEKTTMDERSLMQASVCANCANQSDCRILAATKTPIYECELYECCALAKPELVGREKGAKTNMEAQEEGVHLLGLCANCENRQNCKLPKPSAGVWHCEEYC